MKGFRSNIEQETVDNKAYRKVIFTTSQLQLVLMNIPVGEDINREIHKKTTQFIRIEKGKGVAYISGYQYRLKDGDSVVIPANTEHYIKNTGSHPLKLYTIYAPPEHKDGLVQLIKEIND